MFGKHSIEEAAYKAALSLKNAIDLNPLNRANYQALLPEIDIGRKQILFAFKKITGCTFITYQRYKRMEVAAEKLLSGMTIKEVTITCGYNGYVGNFSRDFKAVYSKGPDEWLKDRPSNVNKHAVNKIVSK